MPLLVVRLIPLRVGKPLPLCRRGHSNAGRETSTVKEDSTEFRGSMCPDLSKSSHMSPFLLTGSHSLRVSATILAVETLCKAGNSTCAVTQPDAVGDFVFDFQQFQLCGS